MIVEFPFFGAGINYFPTEISALRVFEPRYLLLIADSIKNQTTFCVGGNLESIGQIVSEVEIVEHQDISNAEQIVVVQCINIYKVSDIDLQKEYPTCFVDEIIDVGLPPSEEELLQLQSDIKKVISMLIEQGLDMQLPDFEIDTESRIISLWNLCTKVPMSIEMRNKLLSHNSIDDRFEELNNYVQLILKKSIN